MHATATPYRPLVPDDLRTDRALIRCVTALAVAAGRGRSTRAADISRQFWPRDTGTLALVERAAGSGATTTGTGWAIDLVAPKAVAGFIGSLQDNSAGAALIAAAPRFNMPGFASIALPRATSGGGPPAWTAEAAPIPVGQGVTTGPVLGPPKKLALIESYSRELSRYTPEAAEEIIGTILRDAVARQLDLSLFSAVAADSTRPAGILAGVTPLTATVGGALGAVLTDMKNLVDAVVAGGGGGAPCLFFTSPGRALALLGYMPALAGRVFGSASIISTTLIAIDPRAFASMFGTEPELMVSQEGLLHYEDTTPLQIATGAQGSGVLATPAREAFQTDAIVIRMILWCAWTLRVPGAVSAITGGISW